MKKILSFIASFSLLLNSFYVPAIAIAQELSPTPEPTPVVESTETLVPTVEITSEPTQELGPTETPVETTLETLIPTPTIEVTIEPTQEPIQSDEPAIIPTSTSEGAVEVPTNVELEAVILENTDSDSVQEFDFYSNEYSSASLITDKADYAPTDTVLITGNGFLGNKEYGIEITSETGNFKFSDKVTSDESGGLFYAHQLDGTYRPNYKVEVKSGEMVVTSTTFTDTANPIFSWPTWNNYLVNGLPVYDDEAIGGHADPSNGGTGVSPSEIDISSQACTQSSDPGTQPSVLVNLTTDSNYQFYRMRLAGDPRAPGNSAPIYKSYHWDILLDTDHNGYANYVVDLFGDTLSVFAGTNTTNTYSPTNPLWTASATKTTNDYTEVVQTNSGCNQYFLDYAIPTSAFTGSNLTTLQSANLFFSTSASNTDPLQKDWMGFSGFIFGIAKQVSTDGITWGESSTVTAGTQVYFKVTLTNTGNADITGVSIQDTLPSGFTYISGSTSGVTTSNPTISSQTLTWGGPFTVNANGGFISLVFRVTTPQVSTQTTFTNTSSSYKDVTTLLGSDTADVIVNPANGSLVVTKVVVNDNGGNLAVSIFPLFVNTQSVISGAMNSFTAGTYTVSETGNSGYSVSYSGDCNSLGQVTVVPGITKTCTLTNDDIAPQLTLVKKITKDDGGTATESMWKLSADNPSFTDSFSGSGPTVGPNVVTANVEYTLEEANGPSGYSAGPWVCTGGTLNGNAIKLSLAENVTCTIMNDDQPGTLIVRKAFVGITGDPTQFSFVVNTDSARTFESDAENSLSVPAGIYSISETDPGSSYTVGYSNCNGITVDNGETEICTITNTKLPTLTVNKVLSPSTDNGKFNLTIDSVSRVSDVGNGGTTGAQIVSIGAHTVGEVAGSNTTLNDYNLTYSSNCPDGRITLSAGEDVTCTITNTRKTGNFFIDKIIIGGGPAVESSWFFRLATLADSFIAILSDNGIINFFNNLNTGQYKITESTDIPGYTLTGVGGACSNLVGATATVTINTGDNTCTFTNTRDTGSLKVNKQIDLNADGDYLDSNEKSDSYANNLGFNWKLDNGINQLMDSILSNIPTTIAGSVSHSVTETSVPGYHYVGWTTGSDCSTLSGTEYPVPTNIAKDTQTSITLCNARDAGTVTVVKNTIGGDGTFEFRSDGLPSGLSFNISTSSNTGNKVFNPVTTGTYHLYEVVPAGWQFTNLICNDNDGSVVSFNATINLQKNENVTCTYTNTKLGSITIIKDSVPNDSQDFRFTASGPTIPAGTSQILDDDPSNSIQVNTWAYSPLPVGLYTFGEDPVSGWDLTNISCIGGSDIQSDSVKRITLINLKAGENVVCTFINERRPLLRLNKTIVNDNNGNATLASFTPRIDGNNVTWNTPIVLDPGLHTASELMGVTGYTPSAWGGDCATNGTITLSYGDSKICTITNDDIQPKLTVTKVVIGDSRQVTDFTLKVNTTTVTSGVQYGFNTGNYTVSEQSLYLPDYNTVISGDCATNGTITLNSGDVKACTVTNTRKTGTLRVLKNVDLNGDGDYLDLGETGATNWEWQTRWVGDLPEYAHKGYTGDPAITVVTGNHYLIETVQPNFHQVSVSCTGASYTNQTPSGFVVGVGAGQNIICTFVNARDTGTIRIYKDAYPANDSKSFDFTGTTPIGAFTLDDNTNPTYSHVQSFTVPIGSYTITEDAYPDWGTLTDLVCTGDNNGSVDLASRTATVNLDKDEIVSCTFTNKKHATLTLNKTISGGSATLSDFTPKIDGNDVTWGTPTIVGYATHTASEAMGIVGYTASNWGGDCSVSGRVALNPGENKICTVTNIRDTGNLQITKLIDADGDVTTTDDRTSYQGWVVDIDPDDSDTDDPSIPATDSSGHSLAEDIKTGNYWVSEDENGPTDNYHFLDSYCIVDDVATGNSGTSSFGGVEVKKDKTTYCTFVNVRDTGTITIDKITDPSADQTVFTINLNQGLAGDPTLIHSSLLMDQSTPDTFSVPTGEYWLEELLPTTDWVLTNASCTNGRSSFDPRADGFTLNSNDHITCTFTNTKLSSIQGKKFEDMNGDGDRDPSDTFLNGWTINLYKQGEGWEFVESKTTGHTGTLGQYRFEDLMPDRYLVCEVLKDDWMQTAPVSGIGYNESICFEIDLSAGQNLQGYQFGNFKLGKVQGMKYEDSDGDGLAHETGESYLNKRNIRLYKSWEEPVTVTTSNTGETGQYRYENLLPGTYYACEVKQPDWAQTWPNVGDYPVTDSGVTHSEYGVAVNNLSGAEDEYPVCWQTIIDSSHDFNQLLRFGNARLSSIHGYKWNDINGDGERCTSNLFTRGLIDTEFGCEEKLPGWTIELYKITEGDGQDIRQLIDSMQTDSGEKHFGWYWFENLLPGIYEVCEVNKPGWEQTYPGSCHRVILPDENSGHMVVSLNAVLGPEYNFGNFLKDPKVEITKSNNKNNAQRGDTVTYTLTLTNSGNMNLNNVKVIDALPGGFSYIAGTSMLDGLSISDPTISGNTLEWNIGSIEKDGVRVISYDAKISDSVINGSYKNLATCNAEIGRFNRGFDTLLFAAIQVDEVVEITECNIADSTVNVGLSYGYGGNLNGQVLGASIELPATGNPTWILIFAISGLIIGLFLKKKYAKN